MCIYIYTYKIYVCVCVCCVFVCGMCECMLPGNREDTTTTMYLMPPRKTFSIKNWIHLGELLTKGVPWDSPKTTDYHQ